MQSRAGETTIPPSEPEQGSGGFHQVVRAAISMYLQCIYKTLLFLEADVYSAQQIHVFGRLFFSGV
jgi:hypothetical protein